MKCFRKAIITLIVAVFSMVAFSMMAQALSVSARFDMPFFGKLNTSFDAVGVVEYNPWWGPIPVLSTGHFYLEVPFMPTKSITLVGTHLFSI